MPWKIDKNNCVVRADTGKTMKCYPKTSAGKAKAEAYLKALYANAPKEEKQMKIITRKRCKGCKTIIFKGKGNMAGLAKHISHMVGEDPDFHAKCTGNAEVQKIAEGGGYDINALCAKAHKLVVGEWPGGQSDEGSMGARAKKELSDFDAAVRQAATIIMKERERKVVYKGKRVGNKIFVSKGGSGSGNFGHQGRPGKVGGSVGGGVSSGATTGGKPHSAKRRVHPADIIQVGYEIASSNAEGGTDFDEALRIYSERNDGYEFTQSEIDDIKKVFEREFPGSTSF